jgi:hypothetical protein
LVFYTPMYDWMLIEVDWMTSQHHDTHQSTWEIH